MAIDTRDLAELWHWRSRTTQLLRRKPKPEPPAGWTFERIISTAAASAYERGASPPPIQNDFPAFGKAYAELDDDEYAQATSIALERHKALNWLCGYARDWDLVPTDT